MSDEPFYAPTAKPLPPCKPRPPELLFEFLRTHDRFRCELRYQGEWGVEAQFLKNEELLIGRRFELREQAVRWAEEMRTVLEKGGCCDTTWRGSFSGSFGYSAIVVEERSTRNPFKAWARAQTSKRTMKARNYEEQACCASDAVLLRAVVSRRLVR